MLFSQDTKTYNMHILYNWFFTRGGNLHLHLHGKLNFSEKNPAYGKKINSF